MYGVLVVRTVVHVMDIGGYAVENRKLGGKYQKELFTVQNAKNIG